MRLRLGVGVVLAVIFAGCGERTESGADGSSLPSPSDSGFGSDAGTVDAGIIDAGVELDAGDVDAGDVDAGDVDAGDVDAGYVDAGDVDAGNVDAGGDLDAGSDIDAGGDADAGGNADAGRAVDAGAEVDAGAPDAGGADAGLALDAGSIDAGAVDAGPPVVTLAPGAPSPSAVALFWDAGDSSPLGFELVRDGVVIAQLDAGVRSFFDLGATAGQLLTVDAGATTSDSSSAIELTWALEAHAGPSHTYSLIATYQAGVVLSNEVSGARASPTLAEWRIDSGDGGQTLPASARSWIDPVVAVTNLGISARPDDLTSSVLLSADASVPEPPPAVSYNITPVTLDGLSTAQTVSGSGTGHPTLQWQRSTDDSPTTFVDLPKVHGPWWFDTDAVFNEGRYYRLVVRSGGVDVFASAPARALLWRPRAMALLNAICLLFDNEETLCVGDSSGRGVRGSLSDVLEFTTNGANACGLHSDGGVSCYFPLPAGETPMGLPPVSHLVGNARLCGLSSTGWSCLGSLPPDVSGLISLDPRNTRDTICGHSAFDGGVTCVGNAYGLNYEAGAVSAIAVDARNNLSAIAYLDGGSFNLPPSDSPYTSISSSVYNGVRCGRRADGEVRCAANAPMWWSVTPPSSEYLYEQYDVEPEYSERMSCGLTPDHRVRCGAIVGMFPVLPPLLPTTQILAVDHGALSIIDDGRLVARGRIQASQPPASADRFVQIVQGESAAMFCGLRTDGSALCWGGGAVPASSDRFDELAMTWRARCGRRGGTITCWQGGWQPAGTFLGIFSVQSSICGRRDDGVILCDVPPPFGIPAAPVVQFAANSRTSCGLTADGILQCAPVAAPARAAGRRFRQVAASYNSNMCALAFDGEAICWGQTFDPPFGAQTPFEDFVSVSVSEFLACGVRADTTTVCWPEADWYRLPH